MHNEEFSLSRIMPAMSRAIAALDLRKLLLGAAIVGTVVLAFAVTLHSLLATAQERQARTAASPAHAGRHN